MKRREMIKRKERFNYIIRKGYYNKDKYYVIYYVPREYKKSKFGIAIKNSVGHAVVRNRLKRQTRSIIDENKKLFKNEYDYIIMIREGCLGGNFVDMCSSFVNLVKGIK